MFGIIEVNAHSGIQLEQQLKPASLGLTDISTANFFNLDLTRVVGRVDNTIHRISRYPVDTIFCFANTRQNYEKNSWWLLLSIL